MRPLPVPREEDFTSRLRSRVVTSRVGLWLGICFGLAFLTGLISHWAQVPQPRISFPTRPVWGYRLTQGLHVIAGTAAVPLLLVKLWSVYPKLFTRPPREWRRLAGHLAERVSIGVLVAAAIFQLATGVANTAQWYPWAFSFRATHYAVAWLAIGALIVHVAAKLPLLRLRAEPADQQSAEGLSRRGLLRATGLAAGLAVVATAGGTVPVFRRVSPLAVRSGRGPAGVPVNKTAAAAGVLASAAAADYRLVVKYADREVALSAAELTRLAQTEVELPLACVEGWSVNAAWGGVRVRELLDLVSAPRGHDVRITSLQEAGPFRETTLPAEFADDPVSLVALRVNGERLNLDHGYPARLIAPNRPGVLQTKWLARIEVIT